MKIDFLFPTYRALSDYREQRSIILIETYEEVISSLHSEAMRYTFGEDGLYLQLEYHQKQIEAAIEMTSSSMLSSYLIWRSHVLMGKSIDLTYLLYEYDVWSRSIRAALFEAYSSEFTTFYNQIIDIFDTINAVAIDTFSIDTESVEHPLLSHLLQGNIATATRVLESALSPFQSASKIIDTIISPSLKKVGEAWEIGRISVAQEHRATSIAQELIDSMMPMNDSMNIKGNAFIILPEDQLHRLAVHIVEKLLRKNGWKTAILTLNEKFDNLTEAIIEFNPKLLVLSATLTIHVPLLQRFVTYIHDDFKLFNGLIAAGGGALYACEPPIILSGVDFQGNSLETFETFLLTL